jgi:hypothetical protein
LRAAAEDLDERRERDLTPPLRSEAKINKL